MPMENDESCTVHPLVLQLHKLFNRDLVEKYEFVPIENLVRPDIIGFPVQGKYSPRRLI